MTRLVVIDRKETGPAYRYWLRNASVEASPRVCDTSFQWQTLLIFKLQKLIY